MTTAARTLVHRWRRHLFALSGLATLAASIGAPVLLPYPLLVASLRWGWRLPAGIPDGRRLLIATLAACLVLETGAWAHNFIRDAADPALFHPQLLPDLLMAAGFYAGWWLAWWWLLRRWRFTTGEVFTIAALYGVFIEQQGRIFLLGLQTLPTGALLWLFVALAYGSTMALAHVWAGGQTAENAARPHGRWKYPAALAAMCVGSVGLMILWNLPLSWLDAIPPERLPMRSHPFW